MNNSTLEFDNKEMMREYEDDCKKYPERIKFYEEQGVSLINMALYAGCIEFAEWLVENGAEVNISVDGTPLRFATLYGNSRIIKKIYKKTNEEYRKRSYPMTHAIYSGKTTNVDALLALGFDINGKEESTPLHTALTTIEVLDDGELYGEISTIKKLRMIAHLIKKGALLDDLSKNELRYLCEEVKTDDGKNILYFCEDNKLKDLVNLFLQYGADPNCIRNVPNNVYNESVYAIEEMAVKGCEEIVYALYPYIVEDKRQQIDFNIISNMYAHLSKNNKIDETIFAKLFSLGVSPDTTRDGARIIWNSIYTKKYELVKILIKHGADITPTDKSLLVYVMNLDEKEKMHDIHEIFNLLMDRNHDLGLRPFDDYSYNFDDIFDLAIKKKIFHWFEPYKEKFESDVKELYINYRLQGLFEQY